MEVKGSLRSIISLALVMAVMLTVTAASYGQDTRPRYSSRQNGARGLSVPEDTVISVQMNGTLSSRTSRVGDKFTATVTIPVYVDGRTVIPAGTIVEGRVTQVTPAKRMSRSGSLGVDFDSLVFPDGSRVNLVGSLTSDDPETRRRIDDESRVSGEEKKRAAVFIGGGGAVGAVLGGIAGGGKGAVVGGVLGAGAGVAGILLSKGEEAQVPSGTPFGVQLRQALVIREGSMSDPVDAQNRDQNRDPDPRDQPADDPNAVANQPDNPRPDNPRADRPSYDSSRPPRYESPRYESPRPETSSRTEPSEPSEPAGPPLPLSSPEMIRRAQVVLKEQGYFEGQADGAMTARTSAALKVYQREHNINESGDLDPQTAKSLGILGASTPASTQPSGGGGRDRAMSEPAAAETVMANVLSATTNRTGDGAILVVINTQANTGGWKWFGEHVVNGDTLEVYARAIKPTGMVTQALTRGRIELTVKDNVEFVRRVVIHSAGPDQTIMLGGNGNRAGGAPAPSGASGLNLQRQAEDLLAEFQRAYGMRVAGSSIELDRRTQFREQEIELLFAIDSFVNASQLYSRLAASLQDAQGQRGAALALARQARRTDRVISMNQVSGSIATKWDAIRQDVLRLMQSYNIASSELDD